jgi:hypothetical protein
MNMRIFGLGLIVGMMSACLFTQWGISAASKDANPKGIPPEAVADYVHSVIQADRTIYTTEVVERMQMRGIVFAAENWREAGKLPLPAQFLIEAGRLVAAEHGSGLRFKLISSWAINKKNRPISDFERTGLTEILVNPDRPYTGMATENGARVFQALYPDKAVSQSCVGCHNGHADSPKKDFKRGDVMGGILLTIPLPR